MGDEPNTANRLGSRVAAKVEAATAAAKPEAEGRTSEQDRQSVETWGGHGIAGLSPAQSVGLGMGMLIGGLVGAIVFLPVGFINFADIAVGWRLLIAALIGAIAGGTAGAVYWGGRAPEVSGEMPPESSGPRRG